MSEDPIYVRYVYLTPKAKELLEALEKAWGELELKRIPREQEPPLPSAKFARSLSEKVREVEE